MRAAQVSGSNMVAQSGRRSQRPPGAGTKAAIVGYAKGVARDLGRRNITVNVIQPGVMPTDMAAEVLGDGIPDALMNLHVIRRIATLEEVSAVACVLAGPTGSYMTSGVIDVSGGLGI